MGTGRYTWSDGSSYDGGVSQGLRSGRGTFTNSDGTLVRYDRKNRDRPYIFINKGIPYVTVTVALAGNLARTCFRHCL